jgi:hypothetical protein
MEVAMMDEEPSAEELAGAEELQRALDGSAPPDGAAELIRALHAPPLGELAARRIAREAFARRRRPRWPLGVAAAASVVAAFFLLSTPPAAPRVLFTAPFPAAQTAAQRLDLVASDRLMAFRASQLYGVRR